MPETKQASFRLRTAVFLMAAAIILRFNLTNLTWVDDADQQQSGEIVDINLTTLLLAGPPAIYESNVNNSNRLVIFGIVKAQDGTSESVSVLAIQQCVSEGPHFDKPITPSFKLFTVSPRSSASKRFCSTFRDIFKFTDSAAITTIDDSYAFLALKDYYFHFQTLRNGVVIIKKHLLERGRKSSSSVNDLMDLCSNSTQPNGIRSVFDGNKTKTIGGGRLPAIPIDVTSAPVMTDAKATTLLFSTAKSLVSFWRNVAFPFPWSPSWNVKQASDAGLDGVDADDAERSMNCDRPLASAKSDDEAIVGQAPSRSVFQSGSRRILTYLLSCMPWLKFRPAFLKLAQQDDPNLFPRTLSNSSFTESNNSTPAPCPPASLEAEFITGYKLPSFLHPLDEDSKKMVPTLKATIESLQDLSVSVEPLIALQKPLMTISDPEKQQNDSEMHSYIRPCSMDLDYTTTLIAFKPSASRGSGEESVATGKVQSILEEAISALEYKQLRGAVMGQQATCAASKAASRLLAQESLFKDISPCIIQHDFSKSNPLIGSKHGFPKGTTMRKASVLETDLDGKTTTYQWISELGTLGEPLKIFVYVPVKISSASGLFQQLALASYIGLLLQPEEASHTSLEHAPDIIAFARKLLTRGDGSTSTKFSKQISNTSVWALATLKLAVDSGLALAFSLETYGMKGQRQLSSALLSVAQPRHWVRTADRREDAQNGMDSDSSVGDQFYADAAREIEDKMCKKEQPECLSSQSELGSTRPKYATEHVRSPAPNDDYDSKVDEMAEQFLPNYMSLRNIKMITLAYEFFRTTKSFRSHEFYLGVGIVGPNHVPAPLVSDQQPATTEQTWNMFCSGEDTRHVQGTKADTLMQYYCIAGLPKQNCPSTWTRLPASESKCSLTIPPDSSEDVKVVREQNYNITIRNVASASQTPPLQWGSYERGASNTMADNARINLRKMGTAVQNFREVSSRTIQNLANHGSRSARTEVCLRVDSFLTALSAAYRSATKSSSGPFVNSDSSTEGLGKHTICDSLALKLLKQCLWVSLQNATPRLKRFPLAPVLTHITNTLVTYVTLFEACISILSTTGLLSNANPPKDLKLLIQQAKEFNYVLVNFWNGRLGVKAYNRSSLCHFPSASTCANRAGIVLPTLCPTLSSYLDDCLGGLGIGSSGNKGRMLLIEEDCQLPSIAERTAQELRALRRNDLRKFRENGRICQGCLSATDEGGVGHAHSRRKVYSETTLQAHLLEYPLHKSSSSSGQGLSDIDYDTWRDSLLGGLNAGQKAIWNKVVLEGVNVIICGEAGTGKSHLLRAISFALDDIQTVSSQDGCSSGLSVSSTIGVNVGTLIDMGLKDVRTVHSAFKLGGDNSEDFNGVNSSLSFNAVQRTWMSDLSHLENVRSRKTIICDEAFVRDAEFWQVFEQLCSWASPTRSDSESDPMEHSSASTSFYAFGGKQVVLCGDPLQLLAFKKDKSSRCKQLVEDSSFLLNFTTMHLDEQMRQDKSKQGIILQQKLSALRQGVFPLAEKDMAELNTWGGDVTEAIKSGVERESQVTFIFAKQESVNKHNERMIVGLSESRRGSNDLMTAVAVNRTAPQKKLSQNDVIWRFRYMATNYNRMTLVVGMPIMTLVNNHAAGYYNGTLGTFVGFSGGLGTDGIEKAGNEFMKMKVVRCREETFVYIAKVLMLIKQQDGKSSTYADQFPVTPAFALTVNKAQGLTLDLVCVDAEQMAKFIDDCGKLYVALSRVRSSSRLLIRNLQNVKKTFSFAHAATLQWIKTSKDESSRRSLRQNRPRRRSAWVFSDLFGAMHGMAEVDRSKQQAQRQQDSQQNEDLGDSTALDHCVAQSDCRPDKGAVVQHIVTASREPPPLLSDHHAGAADIVGPAKEIKIFYPGTSDPLFGFTSTVESLTSIDDKTLICAMGMQLETSSFQSRTLELVELDSVIHPASLPQTLVNSPVIGVCSALAFEQSGDVRASTLQFYQRTQKLDLKGILLPVKTVTRFPNLRKKTIHWSLVYIDCVNSKIILHDPNPHEQTSQLTNNSMEALTSSDQFMESQKMRKLILQMQIWDKVSLPSSYQGEASAQYICGTMKFLSKLVTEDPQRLLSDATNISERLSEYLSTRASEERFLFVVQDELIGLSVTASTV